MNLMGPRAGRSVKQRNQDERFEWDIAVAIVLALLIMFAIVAAESLGLLR